MFVYSTLIYIQSEEAVFKMTESEWASQIDIQLNFRVLNWQEKQPNSENTVIHIHKRRVGSTL